MTKHAEYTARPRTEVRNELKRQGRWSAPNAKDVRSHGRVSADIDGMTPVSEAANQRRKLREQAWADRALTTGNFTAETRSQLTQAYDMPRKAEKFYTDQAIRARRPRPSQTAILRRMDDSRKAREAARLEARKAWRG